MRHIKTLMIAAGVGLAAVAFTAPTPAEAGSRGFSLYIGPGHFGLHVGPRYRYKRRYYRPYYHGWYAPPRYYYKKRYYKKRYYGKRYYGKRYYKKRYGKRYYKRDSYRSRMRYHGH